MYFYLVLNDSLLFIFLVLLFIFLALFLNLPQNSFMTLFPPIRMYNADEADGGRSLFWGKNHQTLS